MRKRRRPSKFLKKNAPSILTFLAVGGMVGTVILAVKETPKALQLLEEEREDKGEELTKFETVVVAAPVYLPAAAMGFGTVMCIVGANVLNKRRQAALVSAYGMLENSYREYRKYVNKVYGEGASDAIENEIAKDKLCDMKPSVDKSLFYLPFYDRYFESTLEDVLTAQYHFNRNFVLRGYANFNELLDFHELEHIPGGDDIGWSMEAGDAFYGYHWVDFHNQLVTNEEGTEFYSIHMPFHPTADYIEMDDYYSDAYALSQK